MREVTLGLTLWFAEALVVPSEGLLAMADD